jgi:hypothetical protein
MLSFKAAECLKRLTGTASDLFLRWQLGHILFVHGSYASDGGKTAGPGAQYSAPTCVCGVQSLQQLLRLHAAAPGVSAAAACMDY